MHVHLIKIACFAATTIPEFQSPVYWLLFDALFHSRSTLEFNHMLIDALFIIIRQNFRKSAVKMVNKCSYFECSVSFIILSVVTEIKLLKNLDQTISSHGVLNHRISNKCINSPIFSYTWKFVSDYF